jgi:phosphocarrier protein HPr
VVERTFTVTAKFGLHARAAEKLVRVASRFRSSLRLERNDGGATADAKSILSVLMLAASCGTQLRIIAEGVDEEQAMKELSTLFDASFEEMDPSME